MMIESSIRQKLDEEDVKSVGKSRNAKSREFCHSEHSEESDRS